MNDPIKEEEVKQAIKSLKNNKSTGPDQLKNEFIKYGGGELKSLSQTYNKIFENETIPISWNKSNTTNFNKVKPDKELLDNKRGISLTNNM